MSLGCKSLDDCFCDILYCWHCPTRCGAKLALKFVEIFGGGLFCQITLPLQFGLLWLVQFTFLLWCVFSKWFSKCSSPFFCHHHWHLLMVSWFFAVLVWSSNIFFLFLQMLLNWCSFTSHFICLKEHSLFWVATRSADSHSLDFHFLKTAILCIRVIDWRLTARTPFLSWSSKIFLKMTLATSPVRWRI